MSRSKTPRITGQTLVAWGHEPGPWFKEALARAATARAQGADEAALKALVATFVPPPVARVKRHAPGRVPFTMNIRAETVDEVENVAGVERHMAELMRVPTVRAGAVMPDACVSGSAPGTIPVGGVIATENAIHPGMHSADICCSMAVSIFAREVDATRLLDAGIAHSHFGAGGRPRGDLMRPEEALLEQFAGNAFLKHPQITSAAIEHHGTQGDGNHFFYVGRLASTGKTALVTHHGSRKPGALLYKAGMLAAERHTAKVCPEVGRHNAWLPADTDEGREYWAALQIIRAWTKSNHRAIHTRVAATLGVRIDEWFWNEHNFVFQRSDGRYYHGKGATPAWPGFSADTNGLTLIPLNMAEPVLIARGLDASNGLGFAPHGAGRNASRTAYLRSLAGRGEADVLAEQTQGIDARFYCGIPDLSELPGAYKNAGAVRAQIGEYGLAEIVDTIEPQGSIMAGEWDRNAPWKRKKARPEPA